MRLNRLLLPTCLLAAGFFSAPEVLAQNSSGYSASRSDLFVSAAGSDAGIREVIPAKYRKRYNQWKDEFLSADIARQQWEMYAHHSRIALTITMSNEDDTGAGSGNYKWNEAGELVAATITLGSRIDQGFPSSVYYPVMTALEPFRSANVIGGSVLAAAKLAHEFGHIMKISTTPKDLYSLQIRLVPVYNQIFLHNGHNVNDPRLVDLARKMGGNPVEIWADREYWGEANAMLYLRDRVAKEKFHCRLFGKIKEIVDEYARGYEERFAQIAKSQATSSCNWR